MASPVNWCVGWICSPTPVEIQPFLPISQQKSPVLHHYPDQRSPVQRAAGPGADSSQGWACRGGAAFAGSDAPVLRRALFRRGHPRRRYVQGPFLKAVEKLGWAWVVVLKQERMEVLQDARTLRATLIVIVLLEGSEGLVKGVPGDHLEHVHQPFVPIVQAHFARTGSEFVCFVWFVVSVGGSAFSASRLLFPCFPVFRGLRFRSRARSKFNGSKFNGSKFNGSKFNGSKFNGSRFNGSKFNGSRFNGSRFNGSRFNGSRFNGSGVQRHPVFPSSLFKGCDGVPLFCSVVSVISC